MRLTIKLIRSSITIRVKKYLGDVHVSRHQPTRLLRDFKPPPNPHHQLNECLNSSMTTILITLSVQLFWRDENRYF
jgi:hypothetical protein